MSDVFATLAAGTLRSTGNAPAGGSGETAVRVIDPSPDFSRLTVGENLRGTVVGKDDHGHLLVRTRLGVLHLAAHRNLPVGSEVVLQVRSVGPQVILNLLPLETTAAGAGGQAQQGGQLPATTQPQATHALPPNPHDLVQRGQVIRGVLHAAAPLPLLAGLPTAQPGAELLVRILSFGVQSQSAAAQGGAAPQPGLPATGGTAAGSVSPTSNTSLGAAAPAGSPPPAAGTPTAAPGSPGSTATNAQTSKIPGAAPTNANNALGSPTAQTPGGAIPATGQPTPAATAGAPGLRLAPQTPVGNGGHTLATALQSVSSEAAARAAGSIAAMGNTTTGATPGTAAATPTAGTGAESALRITGLVIATTNGGQPILHTALGTMTLDTRAGLPPGSSLALQITLPAVQNTPAAQALAAAWPSLEALEENLLHSLPPAQMEAVARALPQVGPRLASGVLFFLSALNQGNLLGWMAPAAAAALERGEHGELYERLGREFAGLSRSIETPAGEWRFVNLPLWSEAGLRELRCFFRHQGHGGGKGGGDGDKATRFVLELELHNHGELQLDGLVRGRRFDLMLRSRHPLPAVARGDLMALFEEANAIAGYSGQLVFQASNDWLQMLAAQAGGEHHEGFRV